LRNAAFSKKLLKEKNKHFCVKIKYCLFALTLAKLSKLFQFKKAKWQSLPKSVSSISSFLVCRKNDGVRDNR